jgi:GFO/IDH/MocA C-terminal domain
LAEARTALEEALSLVEKNDERFQEAELQRLEGELVLAESGNQTIAAECFQRAVATARRQQSKAWELRAMVSLARLWRKQGRSEKAFEALSVVHGTFTEGFTTPDLMDAAALLESLSDDRMRAEFAAGVKYVRDCMPAPMNGLVSVDWRYLPAAGGPLLDLGTYPVSFLTAIFGVPKDVKGVTQFDPSGVHGQLSAILTDADGNQGTCSTTLYGFTPTNAIVVGTEGTIQFDRNFHLPGPFTVSSDDGSQTLRYEEAFGRHFEGLYYEAAEVARCITAGELETPYRTLDASLNTMATLDMIRRSVGIDFSAAGLVE